MKKLVTFVTAIFVISALFAQKGMPAGIHEDFNSNKPFPQKQLIIEHDKIPGEVNSEFLYVKNINGTIWVKDSTLWFKPNGAEWDLESREKVLSRDDFGNMTTAISHAWDNVNETWMQYLDTISATYYNTDFIHEYFKKGWNNQTNEWNDTSEYRLNNEDGNGFYYIRRSWDYASNSFQGYGVKVTQTFDENRILIKQLGHYWDADSQEWVNPWLDDPYVYDDNGNLIELFEYSWDTITEEWVNSIHFFYAYDGGGNLIQWKQQIWDSNTEEWVNWLQQLFTYDNNGNQTLFQRQFWDSETEEWVNNLQILRAFDDNDNETQLLFQIWDDGIGEWVNSQLYLYTYDDDNKLTHGHGQFWNNDEEQWVNNWLHLYTYDDNGNKTERLGLTWDNDAVDWRNDWKDLFAYDDNSLKIQDSFQGWDTETGEWVYHWRNDYYWSQYEITGVDNVENNYEIAIYPNPSNGLITITSNFKLNNKIEIVSVTGQMVHSISITSVRQQIDLRSLSKGVYFIKVIGDKHFKTEKLIIK